MWKFLKWLFKSPFTLMGFGFLLVIATPDTRIFGLIIAGLGVVWFVIRKVCFPGSTQTASLNPNDIGEGANDLFIELNKGSTLTIKDDYIWGPDGYRLGSITDSGVHSRGRQIGNIKENAIYDLNGNLICHIENGCLVKK